MITDLLFSILIVVFIFFGLKRPHVALLGVVWVDTITPQLISTSFLTEKPLSLLLTLAFFASFALNFSKVKGPKSKGPLFLLALLALWMTISTYQAHYQELAWFKYGIVIKTIILSSFIPFVLDTRKKIELFIWVFVASVGFYLTVGGLKTFFGGGGYGIAIIQTRATNSGITETSTLSIMAVVVIALVVYLKKYSEAVRHYKWLKWYANFLIFIAIFSIIGTFARSGLIAGAAFAFMMFLISKNKAKLIAMGFCGLILMIPMIPDAWMDRMVTITKPNKEKSALGRIVVWRWTIDYAAEYPFFGGGFYSYIDNADQLHLYAEGEEEFDEPTPNGKAYHNMFFEVLGELGYAGLFIYLLYILSSMLSYWKLRQDEHNEEWFNYLILTIAMATCVYFTGGMFVGIAYSPWFFYLTLLGVSLCNIKPERKHTIK